MLLFVHRCIWILVEESCHENKQKLFQSPDSFQFNPKCVQGAANLIVNWELLVVSDAETMDISVTKSTTTNAIGTFVFL